MKTVCLITVLALALLGGCCKTTKTASFTEKACSPRAMAVNPCPPFVGQTGADGENGPCALALIGPVGEDGPQGPRGPNGGVAVGPTGPKAGPGPAGASLLAPRGPAGEAGPRGDVGPTLVGPIGQPGNPGRAGAAAPGIAGARGRPGPKGPVGGVGRVDCWSLYRSGRNIDVAEAAGFLKATPSLQVKVTGDSSLRDKLIANGVTADRIVFEAGGSAELWLKSLPE